MKVLLFALAAAFVNAATIARAQVIASPPTPTAAPTAPGAQSAQGDPGAQTAQGELGASAGGIAAGTPVTGSVAGVPLPDYRIGLGDALSVVFWRDKDMSADVVVRPDGRVTLPVLNEVEVVGLTTEELREKIADLGRKYVASPRVSILVRQINSRYVFITGKIHRPGPYALYGPMTVLQLIAMAGGLRDYADSTRISVIRNGESGKQVRYKFNYKQVVNNGELEQNTTLKPGDTVVVP